MRLPGLSSPFGSPTRSRILVELSRHGKVWGRDLSEKFGIAVFGVQTALNGLVEDGLIVESEKLGTTVLYRMNPNYFALSELQPFLARLAEGYAKQGY